MELNLYPQTADSTVYEGEGGAYYAWTGAKSPVLVQARLGAGKLVLQPRGFALPHYADSSKIGYVIQGACTVGLISPNSSEEKVLIINKGDTIPVLRGVISWWFNGGDSDFAIIFLGETSHSYTPGAFDYFVLAGPLGFLSGLSTEFITKIYRIHENDAQKLSKSQTNAFIFKLDNNIIMPDISNCHKEKQVIVNLGGSSSIHNDIVTADDFPLLDEIGLSANLVKLEANSSLGPYYVADGSCDQIVYVTKGSGKIQIVGLNGKQILDAKVQEGELFVVPKFFVVAQVADEQGLEFFSVITSSKPVFGHFAGDLSAWKAMSSSVSQASLNLDSQLFKSKIGIEDDKYVVHMRSSGGKEKC